MQAGNCTDESADYHTSGGVVVVDEEEVRLDEGSERRLRARRFENVGLPDRVKLVFKVPSRNWTHVEHNVADDETVMLIPAGNSFEVVRLVRETASARRLVSSQGGGGKKKKK